VHGERARGRRHYLLIDGGHARAREPGGDIVIIDDV
jgi:hypothetical protein